MFLDRLRDKLLSTPQQETNYDQGLIVTILLGGLEDFGSKEQQEEIHAIEEKIEEVLPEGAELDGDEFGDGECTIYMYGPSADMLLSAVKDLLQKSPFTHIEVTLQYGPPQDSATVEKTFSL